MGVPRDLPVNLKSISDLDGFKAVTKDLIETALKALEEVEARCTLCGECEEIQEKLYLIHHCLDYLSRLCEGKV